VVSGPVGLEPTTRGLKGRSIAATWPLPATVFSLRSPLAPPADHGRRHFMPRTMPRRFGPVRLVTAGRLRPSRRARSVQRGTSSTCVSARQRSRCPRSPGRGYPGGVPNLEDDSHAAAAHFEWPMYPAHSSRSPQARVRYDRLKTVADETLRRSHPPSRQPRGEIAAAASAHVRLFPLHNDPWRRSAQARSEYRPQAEDISAPAPIPQ
jgi:hypothetical protein